MAGRGTLVKEGAGAVLPAVPNPLAVVPAGGGARVSTVDAWFAGGAARAPTADTAGGGVSGDEETDEDPPVAVAFSGAALSDADDTAEEGGASDAAFAIGRPDTDVAVDAGGRGACCAFFPCTTDLVAAATAVLCCGVVEMPGGPAAVVCETDTSEEVWTDTRLDCSLDGEAAGMASEEDAVVEVTPTCPADAADGKAGR